MKKPMPKYIILATVFVIAIILLAFELINWRDALLIVCATVSAWHLLCVYILSISKPVVKEVEETSIKQPRPRVNETVLKYRELIYVHEIDPMDYSPLSQKQNTIDELKKIALRDFATELLDYIEMYQKPSSPLDLKDVCHLVLRVVEKNKY